MRLFITKKKLIKEMAKELAYLEINADWWYYTTKVEEKQQMSSHNLYGVTELRCICDALGILKEVYDEAYKIYDFRNSGSDDFKPNVPLIRKVHDEFCEPIAKKRPFM